MSVLLIVFSMADAASKSDVTKITMPPNPERPMNAKTCVEARARLEEAERGSSLVTKEKNQEVVLLARAQLARLCRDQK
jgi:hypothetical protein